MATAMGGEICGRAAARADAHAGCAAALLQPSEDRRAQSRRRLALVLLGIAALAWLALYLWSVSAHADWIDHGGWLALGLTQSLCLWTGEAGMLGVAIGMGAWLLMLAAMMLPTIAPLLALVERAASDRPDRLRVIGAAGGGYLLVWTAFGLAAHGLDAALQEGVASAPALQAQGWIVGAAVIAMAGLYQFSALKESCRAACHAPLREAAMLAAAHETARPLAFAAFRAGLSHGRACIGCCWALMLLMFVVGMSNLAWMLGLAAVMAVEKNFAIGARLGAPIGLALLGVSAMIVGANL